MTTKKSTAGKNATQDKPKTSAKPAADANGSAAPPIKDEEPSKPAKKTEPAAESKPVIHRVTRLDQAQALAELAKGEKFTDATDVHTDIQAFKSADGRTLRVVLAGDSLNSVEI